MKEDNRDLKMQEYIEEKRKEREEKEKKEIEQRIEHEDNSDKINMNI